MKGISIKEYAELKNVSYEAVRSQVKRYEKELKGHVFKIKRKRYLDEYAVVFLDDKRKFNPVIIRESNTAEEINSLKEENERLKTMLLEAQNKIINLQEENKKRIQAEVKFDLLTCDFQKKEARIESLEKELKEADKTVEVLKNQCIHYQDKLSKNSYKKVFLGLYRKV